MDPPALRPGRRIHPHGEDIAAFLKRETAKPIIRWEDSPQLGYEILPNKYFYRYSADAAKTCWQSSAVGGGGGETLEGLSQTT